MTMELHTFIDAFSKAYAAVSYLVTNDVSGRAHCRFVMGTVLAVKLACLIKFHSYF